MKKMKKMRGGNFFDLRNMNATSCRHYKSVLANWYVFL